MLLRLKPDTWAKLCLEISEPTIAHSAQDEHLLYVQLPCCRPTQSSLLNILFFKSIEYPSAQLLADLLYDVDLLC